MSGGESVDRLRQAAARMRALAEGVTPGAQWTEGHYWITDYDPSDPSGQTAMQREIGGMGPSGDAAYYSAMHPALALAVADWLDSVVERITVGSTGRILGIADEQHAIALADAFLGSL